MLQMNFSLTWTRHVLESTRLLSNAAMISPSEVMVTLVSFEQFDRMSGMMSNHTVWEPIGHYTFLE